MFISLKFLFGFPLLLLVKWDLSNAQVEQDEQEEQEYPVEEECVLDDNPHLQIVFALDGLVHGDDISNYKTHQTAITTYLLEFLPEKLKVEFALGAFWDLSDNPKLHKKSDSDSCYKLIQDFTTDKSKIKSGVKKMSYKVKDVNVQTASSTTAVLMAILDKKLHWNKGFWNKNNEAVRKIVVLITSHAPTIEISGTDGRKPFRLDGTDTCSNTLPPTPVLWENTVLDNDVLIVASVLNLQYDSDSDANATDTYFWNFRKTRVLYKHFAYPDLSESVDAGEKLERQDFEPHAKTIGEAIYNESWACEWEYPPSYNTVGL